MIKYVRRCCAVYQNVQVTQQFGNAIRTKHESCKQLNRVSSRILKEPHRRGETKLRWIGRILSFFKCKKEKPQYASLLCSVTHLARGLVQCFCSVWVQTSYRKRWGLDFLFSDMKLGRNVARTFLDYYKLSNLIKDNRPLHIQRYNRVSHTTS